MEYHDLTPLEEVTGLSVRAFNGMMNVAREYNCTTVGQFRRFTDGVIMRTPNVGRKSLKELYDVGLLSKDRETINVWRIFEELRKTKEKHERILKRCETENWIRENRGGDWRINSDNEVFSRGWEAERMHKWSEYRNAVNHWNHYGAWPNGSRNPDDAKLYVPKDKE